MSRGFTLLEIVVVLAVAAVTAALALPRLGDLLDWAAADAAARDVTIAIAVTRAAAVDRGTMARLRITADSLRIDLGEEGNWLPWKHFPGPAARGASAAVSNPEIVFAPTGIARGPSNTTVTVRRGARSERITVSRVGRVKHW